MLRQIHKVPGLFAALLVSVIALSGAVLSVMPVIDRAGVIATTTPQSSVSELAVQVAENYPGVEQIRRSASGKIIVFYFENDRPASVIVDPVTGFAVSDYEPSGFTRWVTILHRSFFLDDTGRIMAGLGAFSMLILTITGLQLAARRMGGWRRILRPARGTGIQRLHVDLGRLAVLGLVLSSVTALYMSLVTFEFIPDGQAQALAFPAEVNGGPTLSVDQITALKDIELASLRELVFPYPADPTDAFTITTDSGQGYIDQATGLMLAWQDNGLALQAYEFIYMLHTGQGLWWLGMILGVMALAVPVMGVTGFVIWWSRRRVRPRIKGNSSMQIADTIILVGSEGGSTWGFAGTLHETLAKAGHKVHTAPMNSLRANYPAAKRMFILAATYGDGAAPTSANAFLSRLDAIERASDFPVAVLGFGDRQFPNFCRFAQDVDAALAVKGWTSLLPLDTIDRQSTQEFERWGQVLSKALDQDLTLLHTPQMAKSHALTLISRRDYGAEVQAPTVILQFSLPARGMLARLMGRAWPRFSAGDLVGILPPGSMLPRYYSLASSTRDGMLEICVRKHPGGLCSRHLHGLRPGDRVQAFIKPNPDFRPIYRRIGKSAPVIMIAAGTGVGPLAGFVRGNKAARPMHIYFGARNPDSDFLYRDAFEGWLEDQRLTSLNTAFSRVTKRSYVQDSLHRDADKLRAMILQGAQIMVCGGRDMAAGVMTAMTEVLAPMGLEPATLKAQGRYAEDVY